MKGCVQWDPLLKLIRVGTSFLAASASATESIVEFSGLFVISFDL